MRTFGLGEAMARPLTRRSDGVLDELCGLLFTSLRRADQRMRGAAYLRGLLGTPGRKSIRNIVAAAGGPATEQSLHHFVSDSTWDWMPVRRALADYVVDRVDPQAWVLRPMLIPKAGNQSVGVGKRFDPELGQTLNAQHAVGLWAAADWSSSPVSWRLHLSPAWLADAARRDRASIPDELEPETIGDCAIETYLGMPGLPGRPLVLDTRELGPVPTVRRLVAAGIPFLARVNPMLRLAPAGPVLPGHGAVPGNLILGAARDRRRPVAWTDPLATVRTALAATVAVRVPDLPGPLHLFGAADLGAAWPAEVWLTNLPAPAPATLLRLSRLTYRVDRDFTEIADRVGIRDFSGRSFVGWHRHVTLASAAHVVTALAGTSRLRAVS